MIVPIVIDASSLQDEFTMSKQDIEEMIDQTVKSISLEYYRLWGKEASKNLNSTRNRYLNNLIYVDEGKMRGAVVLRDEDPLAMMLEDGVSAFDMKENFKKSPKAKQKANGDGWYLTIPMRYAASPSLGESEIFSGVLPREIYEKIQSADTNVPVGGGMRSQPLKLEDIPTQYQEKTTRKAIPSSSLAQARKEYISKSSKYEGLVKLKDTTTNQTRGYMAFRRVSDNSDDSSWIHSGFDKRNFAEKAMSQLDIEKIVDVSIDNFLNQYLS